MADYIYLPVPSEEMVGMAESMASAINIPTTNILANKVEKGIGKAMYRWINKCLSDMTNTDTVYILLHGNGAADSQQVGAQRKDTFGSGQTWKTYTPTQLASTLGKEGLPTSFVNLHICACGSGYDGQRLRPWAERLKNQLTNYPNIRVTGYLGWFSITGSTIRIKDPVNNTFHDLADKAVTF